MYKIPFRSCYANTITGWFRWTFWCHVVKRVFPRAYDLGSDSLHRVYAENPAVMYEQYRHVWASEAP